MKIDPPTEMKSMLRPWSQSDFYFNGF